ncbi:MAG: hypothetical protein HFG65_01685 [Hungatella sp.]|nr:hypothetical protein [Hungatella sp.]
MFLSKYEESIKGRDQLFGRIHAWYQLRGIVGSFLSWENQWTGEMEGDFVPGETKKKEESAEEERKNKAKLDMKIDSCPAGLPVNGICM